MGKLEIRDDCLVPDQYIYLTYTGPDPWGVVKRITDSLKGFFHVSSSKKNHERINWDTTGDPILYWSIWWVKKPFSGYSTARFRIWVQGTKSKVDNTGQFTLRLNADLHTTISGPSFLLKPFWLTYSFLFYNRARRRFVDNCRNYVLNFRNEIKEHYNLGVTSVPQAHTTFGTS